MNKKDLIAAVAEKANITKKEAAAIISAAQDIVTETLAKGENVQLSGFGSFEVKHRAARIGRNPTTGEKKEVPSHRAVAFHSGKSLKEAVSGK